jgi:predicted metalloendopeptidase
MTSLQSDFYLSINEEWLNNNPIPNDHAQWGSFNVLMNETLLKLKNILDNDTMGDDDWNKVRTLWKLGNDENTLNQQNIYDILNPYVNQIFNIKTTSELINFMFNSYICSSPFNIEVDVDLQHSEKNAIYLDCDGLGLPDKDMYLIPEMEDKRLKYIEYLNKLSLYIENNFVLESKIHVNNVYNFEKLLAEHRLSRTDRRDTKKIYNQYNLNALSNLVSSIDWQNQFNNLNIDINKVPYVIVTEPLYFEFLNNLFNTIPIDTWKDYLLIKLFQFASSYTNDILYEINFDFYGRSLSGQPEQKPRWKRVLNIINTNIGEILGKKYVSKYFPESSKHLILDMIDKMKNKLSLRIINSTWLTNETKQKALYKLTKINQKIGYPDKWDDFSKLQLNYNNTYFDNIVHCNEWTINKNLQKYDKLVDKDEWHMTPHTINAYYDPTKNEIVFPAGILQEPFFNPNASIASNYGGIGAVICHEITHGFDDQGCEFDADGNLNNWWTDVDKDEFNKASKKLEEQFNSYTMEGMNINGKLTLGENIADLGGVTITLDCLRDYLYQHPEMNYETELNNFFTQWAIIWRNNIRSDEAKQRILTDPHSPGCLRVNGILKNIDEFYTIFNIKENDEMFIKEENRCLIW